MFARSRLLADMGKLVDSLGVAPREESRVVMANGAPAANAAPAPTEATPAESMPATEEKAPAQ